MDQECCRLTQELLAQVAPGTERLAAMAHLGATVLLFERSGDREMMAVILGRLRRARRDEKRSNALRLSIPIQYPA